MHSEKIPALSPKTRLKFDEARGKPVLLFPEGLLFLNQTAYRILQLCDGQRKLSDIINELEKDFSVDRVAMEKDVWEFLLALHEKGLLQIH
ncbi:pyrroloquinoline quinone biosynthesis peptide chaperone PqqD [Methylacidiphilum caldifontis]|uniref:Pyrroloquinoline quinone biosynthesis protein PqqD n=1 Tax=Methylacidiphilum caldifontis TaxID=2795386 RepID=A0A4Y8PB19_9BACT|nr:pyrroloquinoline quinone biosynthesis peptide chaperone PqqD [Methylacidiphilum caldifontis]QSR88856.1 pyrroloquinoline quinone biosynthesis peptide chaperone PqqD [Methylacidiphilum caldifontis]TFE67879.1 pyrroloquinoline quinone biosynthesis protein PqqD [Methylacidiphilum caldifontis]